VIMKEGERGDYFCVIADGQVKVTKRNKLLNVLRTANVSARWPTCRRRARARRRRHRDERLQDISVPTDKLEAGLGCLPPQIRPRVHGDPGRAPVMANIRLSGV